MNVLAEINKPQKQNLLIMPSCKKCTVLRYNYELLFLAEIIQKRDIQNTIEEQPGS